jgi:hypothetical protein
MPTIRFCNAASSGVIMFFGFSTLQKNLPANFVPANCARSVPEPVQTDPKQSKRKRDEWPGLLVMRRMPLPRFLRADLAFGFSLVDQQIHGKQVSSE